MKRTISIKKRDSNYLSPIEVNIPNICIRCGEIMTPNVFFSYSSNSGQEQIDNFVVLVQCTHTECEKYFALEYTINKFGDEPQLITYNYRPEIKLTLPENIHLISPSFVEIYSQATTAESQNLDQIAGIGYRKASEFLIKDYAIKNHPQDEDKIKTMFLGKVINDYLTDFPKLQTLAKAVTWIGNDETHYVRRHTDKDINNLKNFIKSTALFIAADFDASEALKFTSKQ